MDQPVCVICLSRLNNGPFRPTPGSFNSYPCPRCGDFRISWEAESDLQDYLKRNPKQRAVLSYGIRRMHQNSLRRTVPQVLKAVAEQILQQGLPKLSEQIDNLILLLGREAETEGSPRPIDIPHEFGTAYIGAVDSDALKWVLDAAVADGLIAYRNVKRTREVFNKTQPETEQYDAASTQLSLQGWRRYEELKHRVAQSRVAFMAMPFGDAKLNAVFTDHFVPAVRETGFELRRVIDGQGAGLIDDQIRIQIRRARFLICELTGGNRGAYWEAGYAEGLDRPVIYTCRKDAHDEVHFDANHHLIVLWDPQNLGLATEQLKNVIRATLPTEAKLEDD